MSVSGTAVDKWGAFITREKKKIQISMTEDRGAFLMRVNTLFKATIEKYLNFVSVPL